MYLVSVNTGDFEGWSTKPKFVTEDEEKAKSWVDKFNRIVIENHHRIVDDTSSNRGLHFCYDFLYWYDINYINASYSEIESR